MKKQYITIFVFLLLGLSNLQAQEVREGMAPMSLGDYNSFVVSVPSLDAKSAIDIWKKVMKPFKGKTKFDSKTEEIFTDDAEIGRMSENSIDVYARPVERGKDVIGMTVWFDMGGAFVSSRQHAEAALYARQILSDFHAAVEQRLAENVLASEEKKYKKIEKEIKKLDKKIKKLSKDITQANETIRKAEIDIDKNESLRDQLQRDLQQQNEAVRAAETPVRSSKQRKNRY